MNKETKKIMTYEEAEAVFMKVREITKVKVELTKATFANKLIMHDTDLQSKLKTVENELQEIIDDLLLAVAQSDLLKAGEKKC